MAVAMLLVMRSLIGVPTRNGWRIPFGGPRGLVDTTVTNPTALVRAPSQRRPAVVPGADDGAVRVAVRPVARRCDDQRAGAVHEHPEHVLVPVPDRLPLQPRRRAGAGDRHGVRHRGHGRPRRVGAWPSRWSMPTRTLAMAVLAVASLATALLWAPSPLGRTDSWYGNRDNIYASRRASCSTTSRPTQWCRRTTA